MCGDPEAVAERADELIALGLDGLVFHLLFDGHDVDQVRLAGSTLKAAIGE